MKKQIEIKVAGCALRTAVCIGIAICLLPLFVGAQEVPQGVTISSSPNPVGSGARALGMGGAFIAIADDATAASWNPAGLSRLRKPEFSFALSWFSCREDYSSRRHPEAEGLQKGLARDLNFMSLALPFKLFKRNMIVSLNYQRLYEFERDISTSFSTTYLDTAMPMMGQFRQRIDFEQAGALKAFSPAYAVQVTPDLALGITLNIWTDKLFWSNGWEADTVHHAVAAEAGRQPVQFSSFTHDRYYGFHGWNLNLGFLWDATEMLSIGAVIKTPFRAEMRHEQSFSATTRYANGMILHTSNRLREDVDLEMPLSYGFGVALRWSDRLSFSCDVFRTEWSHFILEDGRRRR
ncbi:MAG: hypothetical protein GY868_02420, partial [Deltaproteobacteria bacterium]|nr:hypothetical protein [Deltaproteobacteria bacterium]